MLLALVERPLVDVERGFVDASSSPAALDLYTRVTPYAVRPPAATSPVAAATAAPWLHEGVLLMQQRT